MSDIVQRLKENGTLLDEAAADEITSLRSVLQSVLVDPPADSDEPDDDATALVKIRRMVRSALSDDFSADDGAQKTAQR